MSVKPIPEGFHSITPGFAVQGVDRAIEFFKEALGAQEHSVFPGPDGKVMHCELRVGDSLFMIGEPMMGQQPHNMHVMLYVNDCDSTFHRAVEAGATSKEQPKDQFWGDRAGRLTDPFGNEWMIATHKEDLTPEKMMERMKEMMAATPA